MSQIINIAISAILLIILIIHNIYQKKKYKNVYKDVLYKKTNKIIILLYILSFILFIIVLITNIILTDNSLSTLSYIINALSISILVFPLTLSNLYIKSFNEEEKISHTKTIITNKLNKEQYIKFKKAGINIILLSKEKNKLKLPIIEENEIDKSILIKNIQIKTNNLNILDKLYNKDNTIIEFNSLEKTYNNLYLARGTHDNYIRNFKYIIRSYTSLIISYIFLIIMGFPAIYNLLLVLILKTFTIITSQYVYRKLPYDKDIMERKVKNKNILLGTQEFFFNLIESFCISFAVLIPYMYMLSQGGSQPLGNTLFFIVYLSSQLFIIYSNLSDSFILINIFKNIKNIRLIIYTIITILLIIFFNYCNIFETRNIYLQNNIAAILFGLIPTAFIELTKLSRYLTVKGKKKNESKNNKK